MNKCYGAVSTEYIKDLLSPPEYPMESVLHTSADIMTQYVSRLQELLFFK